MPRNQQSYDSAINAELNRRAPGTGELLDTGRCAECGGPMITKVVKVTSVYGPQPDQWKAAWGPHSRTKKKGK